MKLIWPLLLSLCCWYGAAALPVPASEAEAIAGNWYAGRCLAPDTPAPDPATVEEIFQDGLPVYYLYTFPAGGFVITPADDALPPILGYSPTNRVAAPVTNPALAEWLRGYRVQIAAAIRQQTGNRDTRPLWDAILSRDFSHWQRDRDVAPLLATTWDQNYPYNSECPEDPEGPGGHVYAGCVATAAAQVMKYWDSPLQGTGSHTYYHPAYGWLTADFGATTYNWLAMPDHSSSPAVALLMFHLGVALNMDYGPYGSGAYTSNVANILPQYFGYDPVCHYYNRDDYADSVWDGMLREQLDSGHPMVYRGHGDSGGHAFVCDGYEGNDHFHFNWGWSGFYNGYYYLNNLNPGGYTFNNFQGAILDIEPLGMVFPELVVAPESFEVTVNSGHTWNEQLTIGNIGEGVLEFSFDCVRAGRDITGTFLSCDPPLYQAGTTMTLILSLYNASLDDEWLTGVSLDFPYWVNLLASGDFEGGGGGPLVTDNATGNGVEVTWSDANGGRGNVYPGETVTAFVEIEIAPQQSGTLNLPYTVTGDGYGADPHQVTGVLSLAELELPDWLQLSVFAGTVAPGEELPVTLTFSGAAVAPGDYSADLLLNSNDPDAGTVTIPLALTVVTVPDDTIRIAIAAGRFELISLPLLPDQLTAAALFGPLSELMIAYAADGGIYLPPYIDTIGEIDPTEGYYLYVDAADTLTVVGPPLPPETVYSLEAGPWNWVGYPFLTEEPIVDALAEIEPEIVIVQADDGRLWIPPLAVNTIGNLTPGEGYRMIVTENLQFSYSGRAREHPGGRPVRTAPAVVTPSLAYFSPVPPTGQPYALIVDQLPAAYACLTAGDEVAVFDGDLCVGAAVYQGERLALTAWRVDPARDLSGFAPGHVILLHVWSAAEGELEPACEFRLGDGTFGCPPYSWVEVTGELLSVSTRSTPAVCTLLSAYPNPFNPVITIEFELSRPEAVDLTVYNLRGQVVAQLTAERFPAGNHRLEWIPATELSAGIYFLQLAAGEQRAVRKISYLK